MATVLKSPVFYNDRCERSRRVKCTGDVMRTLPGGNGAFTDFFFVPAVNTKPQITNQEVLQILKTLLNMCHKIDSE